MADNFIRIDVQGIEKITAALSRFPHEIQRYLGQAGDEAATRVIFPVTGLKKYPPGGPGAPQAQNWTDKQRRYFFWALRNGLIDVPYRRGQSPGSEKFGTQWYSKTEGYNTVIGNRASYGHWLAGDDQSAYMANRGWRRLVDVVQEKLADITKVYNAWVDKCIRDLGLK